MKLALVAALLISACLISIGVHISNLAIGLVLCTVAYITCSSIRTIIDNRRAANAQARQQDELCQEICQGLAKLGDARKVFGSYTGHLSTDEQKAIWSPVVDLKVRTCNLMLARSFVWASASLSNATEKANSLIAQYQPS